MYIYIVRKLYINLKIRLISFIACIACSPATLSGYAAQPIVMLTGGAVTPLGQQSQNLFFANTTFDYDPDSSSALKPMVGGFVGTEYSFHQRWGWQFGLAFYQAASSAINGEEIQAPVISPDAINIWNYHYKILSRQLLFENKLFFISQKLYRPYFLIGLGESFNRAYGFQATPQNSGEVATATFGGRTNKTFIYTTGFGLDADVSKKMRLGVGYRFGYLGKYDLGKGILNTGAGGNIFSLPALESTYSFNHEVLIQLTYLI